MPIYNFGNTACCEEFAVQALAGGEVIAQGSQLPGRCVSRVTERRRTPRRNFYRAGLHRDLQNAVMN